MFNDLLSVLSAHMNSLSIGSTGIFYPDMKSAFGSDQAPSSKAWSSWYSTNRATEQVGKFYVGLSNYLKESTEVWNIPRYIGGQFGKLLYYVASGLQYFYVKMFSLFNIAGTHGGYGFLHDMYKWGNAFGLVIFGVMLTVYALGMILESPGWARHKNEFRNAILILCFLFVMPWGTRLFTNGIQSFATNLLGVNMQQEEVNGSKSTKKEGIPSLPDDIFRHNVVSVPVRLEHLQPGQEIPSDGGNVFQETRNTNANIEGVNAEPLMVDLDNMTPQEVDAWNGLEGESIPRFIDTYEGNNLLDGDSLDQLHKDVEKADTKNGTQSAHHQHATDYYQRERTYHPHIWWMNPGTWDGHHLSDDQAEGLVHLLSYGTQSEGSGLSGTYSDELPGVNYKGHVVQALKHSYTKYDVNWVAIYAGLIMLILILGVYIYKTFGMLFKLAVMYVTSGMLLFRNADNPARVKAWMRDLFSIYEMLMIDIIMIRVVMTVYMVINGFNANVLMHCHSFAVANPWTIAIVDLLGDFALFMASMHGLNSINTMIGSTGGGANSGHLGLGSFLALRTANSVAKSAIGGAVGGAAGAAGIQSGKWTGHRPGRANSLGYSLTGNRIHKGVHGLASGMKRHKGKSAHSGRTNPKTHKNADLDANKPKHTNNKSNRNQTGKNGLNSNKPNSKSGNSKGSTNSTTPNANKSGRTENQTESPVTGSQNTGSGSEADSGLDDSEADDGSDLADGLNGTQSSNASDSDVAGHNDTARHAGEAGAGVYAFHKIARHHSNNGSQSNVNGSSTHNQTHRKGNGNHISSGSHANAGQSDNGSVTGGHNTNPADNAADNTGLSEEPDTGAGAETDSEEQNHVGEPDESGSHEQPNGGTSTNNGNTTDTTTDTSSDSKDADVNDSSTSHNSGRQMMDFTGNSAPVGNATNNGAGRTEDVDHNVNGNTQSVNGGNTTDTTTDTSNDSQDISSDDGNVGTADTGSTNNGSTDTASIPNDSGTQNITDGANMGGRSNGVRVHTHIHNHKRIHHVNVHHHIRKNGNAHTSGIHHNISRHRPKFNFMNKN